jgi:hypothetical protein
MQLTGWLTVIGGCALAGGAIDFFIGKAGQRKVRDWLELRWYQVADIAWDNWARKEAQAYVSTFDRVAGKLLFSKKRVVLSTGACILSLLFSIMTAIINGVSPETDHPIVIAIEIPVLLLLSVLSFALSLSITRWFGKFAASTIGKGIVINISLFSVVASTYYIFAEFWNEFALVVRAIVLVTVSVSIAYLIGTVDLDTMEGVVSRLGDFFVGQLIYYFKRLLDFEIRLRPIFLQSNLYPDFLMATSQVNSLIIGTLSVGSRILFAAGFLLLFLLQGLIRGPISLVWARLVENEKPVFTLVFGGSAAIAQLVASVVSQLI